MDVAVTSWVESPDVWPAPDDVDVAAAVFQASPESDQLGRLRAAYPPFVIVHVRGMDWYAIPIWALNTKLIADTAELLRAEMDDMIASVPVMRFA